MKKEYMVLTHGNLGLLEKQVNEALDHGWNIMGYINFLNGQWVQAITRVKGQETQGERSVE
mgnify:FL=1